MNAFNIIVGIISIVAGLITIFAISGNIYNYCYNRKVYKNGGVRVTYNSGEYRVFRGLEEEQIYQSSKNNDDYIVYREIGKIETRERIKPFKEWNWARRFHDIRVPYYPIQLL